MTLQGTRPARLLGQSSQLQNVGALELTAVLVQGPATAANADSQPVGTPLPSEQATHGIVVVAEDFRPKRQSARFDAGSIDLVLDRRDFLPVLERSPNASRRLLQVLSSRLRRTSEQLEDAVFLVQSARLAKFVLRLARDNGRANGESVTIDLAFTQREIGAMVGVRREAINRQLTAWRDEGLIKMNGRRLSITSMSRFEAHAEDLIWRIPD